MRPKQRISRSKAEKWGRLLGAFTGFLTLFNGFSDASAGVDWAEKGLQSCLIPGAKKLGQCGSYEVPLDYNNPEGKKIKIHVGLLPAVGTGRLADPVFILAGGPGQAAGEYANLAELVFKNQNNRRDVVLVDARGTGKSHALSCNFNGEDDWQFDFEALQKSFAACFAQVDIDTHFITLETITRDLEEVRQRLGYDKINLWGGSYGTRQVAHYMKRYGTHVRAAIADSVLPPDIALFRTVADSAERAFQKLVDDCNSSMACQRHYPDLKKTLNRFLEKSAAGQLRYRGPEPLKGRQIDISIPPFAAIEAIRNILYQADATTILPYILEEGLKDNLSPFIALMANNGRSAGSLYMGMTLSVLCGEEFARLSAEEALEAGQNSFAYNNYYKIWSAYCSQWQFARVGTGLPDDLYTPLVSDVPVLLLSGELDPITPPALAAHMAAGLKNSLHINVSGVGHIASNAGCMPSIIDDFLKTASLDALDTSCLASLKRLPVVLGINGQVQ